MTPIPDSLRRKHPLRFVDEPPQVSLFKLLLRLWHVLANPTYAVAYIVGIVAECPSPHSIVVHIAHCVVFDDLSKVILGALQVLLKATDGVRKKDRPPQREGASDH